MTTITMLTSPRGYRVRFEFLARAGELSLLGESIPEMAVETSRGGAGEMTRERAQRVIARAVRMGWAAVTQAADGSETAAGKMDEPARGGAPCRCCRGGRSTAARAPRARGCGTGQATSHTPRLAAWPNSSAPRHAIACPVRRCGLVAVGGAS